MINRLFLGAVIALGLASAAHAQGSIGGGGISGGGPGSAGVSTKSPLVTGNCPVASGPQQLTDSGVNCTGGSGSGFMLPTAGNATAGALNAIAAKAGINFVVTGGTNGVDPLSDIGFGTQALANIAPNATTNYDTAFGYKSGLSVTTGDHITAFGAFACSSVTTNSHNTCLGIDGLRDTSSSATGNTVVGEQSLIHGDAASGGTVVNATVMGFNAAQYTGGTSNSAFGANTMQGSSGSPLTGNGNSFFGSGGATVIGGAAHDNSGLGATSLTALSSGAGNTGLGSSSCAGVTTGSRNTCLGAFVGLTTPSTGTDGIYLGTDNSTGAFNGATSLAIAIGNQVVVGSGDVCVGLGSCKATAANNNNNVAFGNGTLTRVTSGIQNTAVGGNALSKITTGYFNIGVGNGAGTATLATGHDNILIGTNGNPVDTPAAGTSNYLVIANIISTTGLNAPTTAISTMAGVFIFPNMPSADPHVVGELWSNSGVVTRSAG